MTIRSYRDALKPEFQAETMIENCCLYLPSKVDLKKLLGAGKSNGGLLRKATEFSYVTEDGPVTLKISHVADKPEHIDGFRGYVSQLENTERQKEQAYELIDQADMILGVELPKPVPSESDTFSSLMYIVEQANGFMFVADSILTADGFLVGPMTYREPAMEPAATVQLSEEEIDELRVDVPPHWIALRDQNIAALREKGFECANWLPYGRNEEQLRPAGEIAGRLFALACLFVWVVDDGERAPEDRLKSFVQRNGLADFLNEEENEILDLPRPAALEQHAETIGWRLENMWALAWLLGFEPAPPFYAGQLSGDITMGMFEFLGLIPDFAGSIDPFVAEHPLRPPAEVVKTEDLFYCAHNAVRSAQLGRPTVPSDFDPIGDGGAIHERRHSLTWALSPGVDWDETDLST